MKKVLVISAAVLMLVSCSKESEVFDSSNIEKNQKELYAQQFVKKYGQVSANKTWDLTDFSASLTRGFEEIVTKKVKGLEFDLSYSVSGGKLQSSFKNDSPNKDLYDAVIKTILPDGKEHQGTPVVLTAPSNSFTIYPVSAQGLWTHDLYVKIGDQEPVKLYSKTWTDYSHGYVNGEGLKGNYTLTGFRITQYVDMPGLYVEAPVGTPIEIYLANIKEGKTSKPSVGTFNGQAIYVDSDVKPEGIDMVEDAIIKYVGIEDQIKTGDNDYNDVVLAIVGNPAVPEEIEVEESEYSVTSSVSKRYMIEDLGSTGDFDFNDIVVDVIEDVTNTFERTVTNGEVTSNELKKTEKNQKAILRHLGGVLPFQLTIGNTTLPERQGVLGQDLEEEFEVTGWDPYTNNVSIKVKQQNSDAVFVIPFPKAGEVPMIIATPETWGWMPEKQSVPSDWFYTDF